MAEAEGAWVTDVHGRRYLDMVAAYLAMNFGHRHPQLLQAARAQLERVTLTSRAAWQKWRRYFTGTQDPIGAIDHRAKRERARTAPSEPSK